MTILNSYNKNYSLVQDSHFTGRMALLPESMTVLSAFASNVDLVAGESELQTIRKYELLKVTQETLQPLSNALNDQRLISPEASNVKIMVSYYGSSIAISEKLRFNTPESLMSICGKLLYNQSARLIEVLLGQSLLSGLTQYIFGNGTGTNKDDFNMVDALNVTKILEKNLAPRITSFNRASTQISTVGKNIGYASVTSIEGKFQVTNSLQNPNELVIPAENANISDYNYSFYGVLRRAGQSMYTTSEGINDNSVSRKMMTFGNGCYTKVRRSPLSSAWIYTDPTRFSFGMHSMCSLRTAHGSAITRPEFGVTSTFADKTA